MTERSHAMVVKVTTCLMKRHSCRIDPVGSAPLVARERMKSSSDWIDGSRPGLGGRGAGLRRESALKSICCLCDWCSPGGGAETGALPATGPPVPRLNPTHAATTVHTFNPSFISRGRWHPLEPLLTTSHNAILLLLLQPSSTGFDVSGLQELNQQCISLSHLRIL